MIAVVDSGRLDAGTHSSGLSDSVFMAMLSSRSDSSASPSSALLAVTPPVSGVCLVCPCGHLPTSRSPQAAM